MPASVASTSWAAFSLSNVKIGSPARIVSPSCFNQPRKTPSSMVQPRRGTVIGIAILLLLEQIANGLRDGLRIGNDGGFERRTIRRRRMRAIETADRRVQIVENPVADLRRDFGADAAWREAFVDDEQSTRFRDGSRDSL